MRYFFLLVFFKLTMLLWFLIILLCPVIFSSMPMDELSWEISFLLFSLSFIHIHGICLHEQLDTLLEITMDNLVSLPSFIKFFQEAKNHSASPGNLSITFFAFGKYFYFHCSLAFPTLHVAYIVCSLLQFWMWPFHIALFVL